MARKGFPSDKQDQYMLRLPDGMRDRIKAEAEANNRSINAEIVSRLEQSLTAWPPLSIPPHIVRRVIAAPTEKRAIAEKMISQYAEAIVEKYFPDVRPARDKVLEELEYLYKDLPPHERDKQILKVMLLVDDAIGPGEKAPE